MTAAVEFHTGVADPLGFACRLLRKACRQGARVAVTGPSPTLAALDKALWTEHERDFIPHLRVRAGALPATAARTPIWLVDGPLPAGAPPVLVNLGAEVLPDLAGLTRIIEVVSAEADEADQGRRRWREYARRGASLKHHVG